MQLKTFVLALFTGVKLRSAIADDGYFQSCVQDASLTTFGTEILLKAECLMPNGQLGGDTTLDLNACFGVDNNTQLVAQS
jgi:hypothetical protein